jgi:DNA-binding transcriptional MerR regulator
LKKGPGLEMGQNEPVRGNAHATGTRDPASDIPDKLYFRIGEVARLCEVPAYVLRFWESEFPQLKPNKGGTGQRLYRRRDVELALRVKRLLKEEGYTIPGARQLLKSEIRHKEPQLPLLGDLPETRKLQGLRRELEAIAAILSHPVGKAPHLHPQAIHPIRSQRRAAPARASGRAKTGEFPFDSPPGDGT